VLGQDLGRAADVHDFVVRAISGHATANMQEHDSSVSGEEVRKKWRRSGFWQDWRAGGRAEQRRDPPGSLTTKSGSRGGYANPPSIGSAEPKKQKAQGLPGLFKSGRRDLNPRRPPWQGDGGGPVHEEN
jgi:hypothetical protein